MGSYVPAKKRRRRSMVSEALLEAEEDHFLDCPNADLLIRAAAFTLDVILCFLIWTGIHHSCMTVGTYLTPLSGAPGADASGFLSEPRVYLQYFSYVLKISLVYLYFVWTVARYGGTPAKLLLGLRIVDADTGQKLSYPRALLREGLGKGAGIAAFGAGFFLALVRADLRSFHDLISHSVVKRVHGGP